MNESTTIISENKKLHRHNQAEDETGMGIANNCDFRKRIEAVDPSFIRLDALNTIQLNLGNLYNLSCWHCHINASPNGKKIMNKDVIDAVLSFLHSRDDIILDITGGCPEMNPNFRYLVEKTDGICSRRIVRTNLVIGTERHMKWLAEFYRDHGLVLTASLPCYSETNVDSQRGEGVFKKSIAALHLLNSLGYGNTLELNIVYNPAGACLPGPQKILERDFKKQLRLQYGVSFNKLFVITNFPAGRFREALAAHGTLEAYLRILADNFNPAAAAKIMCRSQISIDWKGDIYNCDFNLGLDMPLRTQNGRILNILDAGADIGEGMEILTGEHCFGCTAGEGSSCYGAVVPK